MKLTVSLLLSAFAFTALACGGDPDANSGGDAYRNEAAVIKVGEEWVTDDLNLDEGDATDWKIFGLESGGRLVIEVQVDDKDAELVISAFSGYGDSIGTTLNKPGQAASTLEVQAPGPGRYFVMVRATGGPPTTYMIRAQLAEATTPAEPGGASGRPGF